MALKYPTMSNQGTAGTRKHVMLMIPQKIEKIKGHESRMQVASYNIKSSTMI